jgi:hypothetical protein
VLDKGGLGWLVLITSLVVHPQYTLFLSRKIKVLEQSMEALEKHAKEDKGVG